VSAVFETHSTTADNERGVVSGWRPGRLSARGEAQAVELGRRRRGDDLAAVSSSDLHRAVRTVSIAFAGSGLPRMVDWRLRECNYGERSAAGEVGMRHSRPAHLDLPYRQGESWRNAVHRVGAFLHDLPTRWASTRVLLVGHVATRWALEHLINGVPLEQLAAEDFSWRPGWEYDLHDSP